MKQLLLPVTLLVLFSACTTSSPYNRGSLSDAMDKSRDDYEGERSVDTERDKKPWWEDDDDEEYRTDPEESETYAGGGGGGEMPAMLAVRGGNAWHSSPYFDSLFDSELLLGFREDDVEILLFGGLKAVEAKPGSDLEASIDGGVLFFRAGVEARYYPFPDLAFLSPYVLGQIGGLYMYWSFKNPIDAGTETIFGDAVGGLILGAGAGVNLIDTGQFRLGAAVIPETHLFTSETHEGFQNDVFDYYGTVRWAFEAGLLL